MDEYIKRQDAYNAILDELVGTGYQSGALRAIEFIPTADVAPKSEVAREIFEEIEELRLEFLTGKITGADLVVKLFLLKKKYTGEQT